jgi:hypothetical protein
MRRPWDVVERDPSPASIVMRPERGDSGTPWAYAVGVLPTFPFVGMVFMAAAVHDGVGWPVFFGMAVVGQLLSFGAAHMDAARLLDRGVAGVTSPRWALALPTLYLWKRAAPFRRYYSGLRPFWTHLVAAPAIIALSVFFATFSIMYGR